MKSLIVAAAMLVSLNAYAIEGSVNPLLGSAVAKGGFQQALRQVKRENPLVPLIITNFDVVPERPPSKGGTLVIHLALQFAAALKEVAQVSVSYGCYEQPDCIVNETFAIKMQPQP